MFRAYSGDYGIAVDETATGATWRIFQANDESVVLAEGTAESTEAGIKAAYAALSDLRGAAD